MANSDRSKGLPKTAPLRLRVRRYGRSKEPTLLRRCLTIEITQWFGPYSSSSSYGPRQFIWNNAGYFESDCRNSGRRWASARYEFDIPGNVTAKISFQYDCASQNGYDYGGFRLINVTTGKQYLMTNSYSRGNTTSSSWRTASASGLLPGKYQLEFAYRKNQNTNYGFDAFRYRNVLVTAESTLTAGGDAGDKIPWYPSRANVKSVSVKPGTKVGVELDGSLANLFRDCVNMTECDLSGFDMSNASDTSFMFKGCSSLTKLDLSNANTGRVTNMESMFEGCTKLESLNVNSLNTLNVTRMAGMFKDCKTLTALDLKSFATSKVTTMASMFEGCTFLKDLNIGSFDVSQVTSAASMFKKCDYLTELNLTSWKLNKAMSVNMTEMFAGDTRLKTIYINSEGWDKSRIGESGKMFENCTDLVGAIAWSSSSIDKTNASAVGYLTAAAVEITLYYVNYTTDPGTVGTIGTYAGDAVTLQTPIDNGHEFEGWYTTPACSAGT